MWGSFSSIFGQDEPKVARKIFSSAFDPVRVRVARAPNAERERERRISFGAPIITCKVTSIEPKFQVQN